MTLELRMWHVIVVAVIAVATLGLASGKLFFSTTTTREVMRTVTVEDPSVAAALEGYTERANVSAAQANVRAAVPSIEAYFADNGTYAGATLSYLQASYDAGIKNVTFKNMTATAYCVENVASTTGGKQYKLTGPGGDIVAGLC